MTAAILLLALSSPLEFGQSPDLVIASAPVVASLPEDREIIQFDVRNNAKEVVTAWKVFVELTLTDGSKEYKGLARDGYTVYAGLAPNNNSAVIPSESKVIGRVPLQPTESAHLSETRVWVAWAIFADGSWIGDPSEVNDVFRRRDRDARASAFTVAALRAGRSLQPGRGALRAAFQQLTANTQEDYDNPIKNVMRRNLQKVIDAPASPGVSPDELLRTWILKTEAAWEAADQHRRAKSIRTVR